MAQTIYTSPPSLLVAGDGYLWQETPDDIADVSSYVIKFRSVEDSDVSFSVTGSDETTYFEFDLTGATTTDLDGGAFTVTKLLTYSWGRKTIPGGKMHLSENPANNPTKSYYQRIVELLESHIEGRLPEGLESHTIGDVPISKIPLVEADALLAKYRYKAERHQSSNFSKDNPGKANGSCVHVHF